MQFIAECYNYKVIHSDSLFGLLYKLINWDMYADCPDKVYEKLDQQNDCFRIRLVCSLLDNLGKYFTKGKRRLLMDRYLIFFQRYILQKSYIYMDLEFMLLDTFDGIRNKHFPKVETIKEANAACRRIRQAEAYQFNTVSVGGVIVDKEDGADGVAINSQPKLVNRRGQQAVATTETVQDVINTYAQPDKATAVSSKQSSNKH